VDGQRKRDGNNHRKRRVDVRRIEKVAQAHERLCFWPSTVNRQQSTSLKNRLAARYRDGCAGDVTRLRAREHHVHRCELAWLCRPFHRDLLAEVLHLFRRERGWNQRSPYGTRRN